MQKVPTRESTEWTESGYDTGEESTLDVVLPDPIPLEGNLFGIANCSIVRDFYFLTTIGHATFTRFSRITVTLLLLAICILTQVFLLLQIKRFVTARAVHDIRVAYDAFENHMYAGHTSMTSNGYMRGVDGYFNETLFHTFDEDDKATACRIPFSEPVFIFVILMIWTLTCVREYAHLIHAFLVYVIQLPVINSMAESVKKMGSDEKDLEIIGLTVLVKGLIGSVIIVRFVICSVLLWMGCRWLVATTDFNDLILNSVALVFILDLKDFLYMILVPTRNKHDLENTYIAPAFKKETPTPFYFLGSFAWFIIAVVWVCTYMYLFQEVLPDYKWDIRQVCSEWRDQRYSLKKVSD